MDLRLKGIGVVALVGIAVLLPLRRPVSEAPAPQLGRQERAQALGSQVARLRLRWSALEQRDSALALIGRVSRSDSVPPIVLSSFPGAPSPMKAEVAMLGELWNGIGPVDSSVRVMVLGYDARRYADLTWFGLYAGNLIAQRDGITWCITILPASVRPDSQVQIGRHQLAVTTAPCVLWAAFGAPGARIRGWLEDNRYVGARSTAWLTRSFDVEGPWAWIPDSGFSAARSLRPSLLRAIAGEGIAALRTPPYWFGARGLRCLVGDRGACEAAILDPGVMRVAEPDLPRDLTLAPGRVRVPWITLATTRPPGPTFLSDLVRLEGRERFRAFWKSELPPDSAFARAFGLSLGEWTARWAKEQWLASWEARYGDAEIVLGVTLRPSWAALTLGWTAVLLVGAGWAARRRQVL